MVTATIPLVPVQGRDHIQGAAEAPIKLLEYGDYECPYCAAAYPIVKDIQRRLGDQLLFGFRNFPLSEMHPHADEAARLAEAADRQGQFWCAHDALFENHKSVVAGRFEPITRDCNLDGEPLKDMQSREITNRLREDFTSGIRGGVNGTPTFFVNGHRYDGSWQEGDLEHALVAELRAARR